MKRLRKKKPKYLKGPMHPDELTELIKEKIPDCEEVQKETAYTSEVEFSHGEEEGPKIVVAFVKEHEDTICAYDVFPRNLRVVYSVTSPSDWDNHGAKELTEKLRRVR